VDVAKEGGHLFDNRGVLEMIEEHIITLKKLVKSDDLAGSEQAKDL
jgi:hypothetical protein